MSSKCQKYKILSTPPKYFSKIKDNDGGGITYYKVIKSSKKITTNPYELCNSIQKKKKKKEVQLYLVLLYENNNKS